MMSALYYYACTHMLIVQEYRSCSTDIAIYHSNNIVRCKSIYILDLMHACSTDETADKAGRGWVLA